jgi:hypothetical protein
MAHRNIRRAPLTSLKTALIEIGAKNDRTRGSNTASAARNTGRASRETGLPARSE